jgi:hypothetical protein
MYVTLLPLTSLHILTYSGCKITDILRNVTVRGEKWKEQGGSAMTNSLSMYIITENIYCSQLSSVEILLQPEPNCFTSHSTRKGLCSLSLCAIVLRSPLPPTCLLPAVNEARSYFATTIASALRLAEGESPSLL